MKKKRVYLFLGTMAELIKLAPIIQELQKRKIPFTIIVSGQTDIHFEEFKHFFKHPDVIYAVTPKGKKSSILKFIIWTIRTFFSLLIGMRRRFFGLNKNNSYFIVHGDTVSSLMGALVAHIYGLKIVHIESGLRSFNFLEPFPEEISRYIVSRLADIHFCPNKWAVNNLKNIKGEKINTGENTLIEIFNTVIKKKCKNPNVISIKKKNKKYFVLVVHRQEHIFFEKDNIRETLKYIFNNIPKGLRCVFLVHDQSQGFVFSLYSIIPEYIKKNLIKISRLPYDDFMHLLEGAEFMITDGGSNQEELYYMGKPCLLLRNHTERIEGLNKNVILSRNNKEKIKYFLINYVKHKYKHIKIKKAPSKIILDFLYEK